MSEERKDTGFGSGAVRSSDANHLDFTSLPLIGLIGVAATASEGGTKYGRYNYMLGMPAHDLLNHAMRHQVMFLLGDRSEPHLEHAAWGLMAAIQAITLDPERSAPHLLGPGATITEAVRANLEEQAPTLAKRRDDKEWVKVLGQWKLSELAEVKALLDQRYAMKCAATDGDDADYWVKNRKEKVADANRDLRDKATRTESHAPVDARTRTSPTSYVSSVIKVDAQKDHMGGCPPLP